MASKVATAAPPKTIPQPAKPLPLYNGPIKKKVFTKADGTKATLIFKPLKKPDGTVIDVPVTPVKQADGTFKFQALPPKKTAAKPPVAPANGTKPPVAPLNGSTKAPTAVPTKTPVAMKAPVAKPAATAQQPAKAAANAPPAAKVSPQAPSSGAVAKSTQSTTSTTRNAPAPAPGSATKNVSDPFGAAPGHGAQSSSAAPKQSFMSNLADNVEGTLKLLSTLDAAANNTGGPAKTAKPSPRAAPRPAAAAQPVQRPAAGAPAASRPPASASTARAPTGPAASARVNAGGVPTSGSVPYRQPATPAQGTRGVDIEYTAYESHGYIHPAHANGVPNQTTQTTVLTRDGHSQPQKPSNTIVNVYETDILVGGADENEVYEYSLDELDSYETTDVIIPEDADEYDEDLDLGEYEDAIEGAEDYVEGELELEYERYEVDGVEYEGIAEVAVDEEIDGNEYAENYAEYDGENVDVDVHIHVHQEEDDQDAENTEVGQDEVEGYVDGREEDDDDETYGHNYDDDDDDNNDDNNDDEQPSEY